VDSAPSAVDEMARRGLDLSAHRSRLVDPELVAGAELVLTMTRGQLREIAVIEPPVLARTMTLPEAARRAQAAGRRRPGEPLAAWVTRLTGGRSVGDVLKAPNDDDIVDPMGGPPAAFTKTAELIDRLLTQLVPLAFP
jgi:protein-tyrosine phosphatase